MVEGKLISIDLHTLLIPTRCQFFSVSEKEKKKTFIRTP
jgi:hypothetical protein